MRTALVVPTNRPEHMVAFLRAWEPWRHWDAVHVVFDGPADDDGLRTSGLATYANRVTLDTWDSIDVRLGTDADLISRRDSSIRSYGLAEAARLGAEVIMTLDDDCFPHTTPEEFVRQHLGNLTATPKWVSSIPGTRVRGLPYANPGTIEAAVSVGLWSGNLDLDAITSLSHGPGQTPAGFAESIVTRVVSPAQFFPMSGMNVAFRSEYLPLFFFAPMGEGQPYRRFDDIWCGLVVQVALAHLGGPIVVGHPLIQHIRASDPFANLEKESPGVVLNERLWEFVAQAPVEGITPADVGRSLAEWLQGDAAPNLYVRSWGAMLARWVDLVDDHSAAGPADPVPKPAVPSRVGRMGMDLGPEWQTR